MIEDPAKQKGAIPAFWDVVSADSRLNQLKAASTIPASVSGVGSWDDASMAFWITVLPGSA